MTTDINLKWTSFSLDLNTIDAWMKANVSDNYCGMSADYDLSLHFTDEPGDVARAAIAAYWSGLSVSSPEHTNYKTAEERAEEAQAAKAALLASANAKLETLGLTADEIAALRG